MNMTRAFHLNNSITSTGTILMEQYSHIPFSPELTNTMEKSEVLKTSDNSHIYIYIHIHIAIYIYIYIHIHTYIYEYSHEQTVPKYTCAGGL